MRIQDQVVKLTQRALDDVLRAVAAVPPDKITWKPAPTARSVFEQMQEVAHSARFFVPLLLGQAMPEMGDHARKQTEELRASFDSVEKCCAAARIHTAEFCQHVANLPDSRLEEEVTLPFAGGIAMTIADVLFLHYWNLTYHHGQICYIQTMLGDLDMH